MEKNRRNSTSCGPDQSKSNGLCSRSFHWFENDARTSSHVVVGDFGLFFTHDMSLHHHYWLEARSLPSNSSRYKRFLPQSSHLSWILVHRDDIREKHHGKISTVLLRHVWMELLENMGRRDQFMHLINGNWSSKEFSFRAFIRSVFRIVLALALSPRAFASRGRRSCRLSTPKRQETDETLSLFCTYTPCCMDRYHTFHWLLASLHGCFSRKFDWNGSRNDRIHVQLRWGIL